VGGGGVGNGVGRQDGAGVATGAFVSMKVPSAGKTNRTTSSSPNFPSLS